jgi:hypothetical protein
LWTTPHLLRISLRLRNGSRRAQSPSSFLFTVGHVRRAAEFANRLALERLHVLKKDASQIGQNARKSVKFLDKMTSGKSELPREPIIIQGPDEQYATWPEVEAHYKEGTAEALSQKEAEKQPENEVANKRNSGGALSQMLLEKLNFAGPQATSPGSTPPMSPLSSEPQSSKTSPEVRVAIMAAAEKSPVPPVLKALLNPVVWYVHEKQHGSTEVFFLTNSADTQHLARDFKVPTKTIHQMRSTMGLEGAVTEPAKTGKKRNSPKPAEAEPRTLFSYEDESDEEEVVFKPRGRGAPRVSANGRGSTRKHQPRSPRPSFGSQPQTPTNPSKPKIPIEEIDPDSFDRGSFGRGGGQLANVANNTGTHIGQFAERGNRGGGFTPTGPARGNHYRGRGGSDRGTARGRGRLFVP